MTVPFCVFRKVASQLLGYVASRETWRIPFRISRQPPHLVVWEFGTGHFTACVFRIVFLGGDSERSLGVYPSRTTRVWHCGVPQYSVVVGDPPLSFSLPVTGVRPWADVGQNPVFEWLYQSVGSVGGPGKVQEVVSVEMQVVDLVVSACEYHRYVQPVSESGFVVHGATGTAFVVGEVSNQESRPAYFGDDLVVYLAQKVRLSVYSYWLVACC